MREFIVDHDHAGVPLTEIIAAETSARAAMAASIPNAAKRWPITAFKIGLGDIHVVYGRNDSDKVLQFMGSYLVRERIRTV